MAELGNLWAIGYDDTGRADRVREEVVRLGWNRPYLILLDVAVVVRHADGSFLLDRKSFPAVGNMLCCTTLGFLAGLVLGTPLTGAALGALLGGVGTAASAAIGISDDFVRKVERLMKPGTSALFILDDGGDMDMILHAIRGLGGTVLRTNVDLERAKLIQATLAADCRCGRPTIGNRNPSSGGSSMCDAEAKVRPYLQIIDSVSIQLGQIKQLCDDPNQRLTDSDAKFQVGGQLADLAEEFASLAKEIERQGD